MRHRAVRGEGELAGLIALAVLGVFVFGAMSAGKAAWGAIAGDTPMQVDCYAPGGERLFSGTTADGVTRGWRSKSMSERATGKTIRLDDSAMCVERELSKAEAAELTAR